MSKLDYIDLVKLWSLGSANGWNEFLTDCERGCMINRLADAQVRIQRGMDKLVREKLNTPEMIEFFCRLSRSIDNTIKSIDKKMNKNIYDNPLNKVKDEKQLAKKRARDQEREAWRKKNSY